MPYEWAMLFGRAASTSCPRIANRVVAVRLSLQNLIKIIVSLAALAVLVYVLRDVDLAQTLSILLGANPAILVAVLLVQALSMFLRLLRWKFQLHPAQDVPLARLISPLLIAYAVGNVTVTAVGMVPRVYLLTRKTGIDSAFIAGTFVQEFILDGTTLLLWALLIPFFVHLPAPFHQVQVVLILPLAILLLVVFSFWRRQSIFVNLLVRLGLWEKILVLLPDFVSMHFKNFGDGLSAAFANPLTLAGVVLCTALTWAVEAVIFWLLLFSLGIPFDYLEASAVMAYTHMVIGIPSVPGFVGTLEAATVGLVLALGGTKAAALAFSVLLRVFLMGPSTIIGLALAWREGWHIWSK